MTRYSWNKELLHIVAKAAHNARYAKQRLKAVQIDVNDSVNLVAIKTGLHRRLHTNLYYSFANSVVISTYNKGKNKVEKERNVRRALNGLRAILIAMSEAAPF